MEEFDFDWDEFSKLYNYNMKSIYADKWENDKQYLYSEKNIYDDLREFFKLYTDLLLFIFNCFSIIFFIFSSSIFFVKSLSDIRQKNLVPYPFWNKKYAEID